MYVRLKFIFSNQLCYTQFELMKNTKIPLKQKDSGIILEDTIKFKISSKVARLLGRESVSSDTAALFELIKNSYDADATKVNISFKNIKASNPKHSSIIISDNGIGITEVEFASKWMVIGTYSKNKIDITARGRQMLGNKGVGRFATEKIAKKVTIISKPKETDERITLEINWGDYENELVDFNDIENKINVERNYDNTNDHGLTIILSDIREEWNAKKIRKVANSASAMLLPKELSKIKNDQFQVIIDAPDFSTEIKPVVESLLFENAPFKVTAFMPQGKFQTTAIIKKEGNIVLSAPINLEDHEIKKTGQKWKNFGNCKVTFYFYPNKTNFENWNEYYHDVLKNENVKLILEEFHGIKIFRDGFWVRPYGGPDDDWLFLEKDRVQSNFAIGGTQVIGFVEITKKGNPGIIDTTTRERLDENDDFESMREFVKLVVRELSAYRLVENKKMKSSATKKIHVNIIKSEIKILLKSLESQKTISSEFKKLTTKHMSKISNESEKLEKEMSLQKEHTENEKRVFRNLAALGITSAASYHEIFNIITGMREKPKSIEILLLEKGWGDKKITKFINHMTEQLEIVDQFTWNIRQFVKAIGKEVESELKKETLELFPEIKQMADSYIRATSSKINVEINCRPEDLTIHMHKADLFSIMLNLLTNAIKSLEELEDENNPTIRIDIVKGAFDLNISFSDNGHGINDDDRNKIFRTFFTTYENGTGLGLTIVREVVDTYGGRIELLSDGVFERGATFTISIPNKNLKRDEE